MSTANYLIIATSAPYAGALPRAAIDMALTTAAFEQQVTVVFRDDAVFQLLDKQDTSNSEQKNIGKMIPALAMYDVQRICAYSPSLANRHCELSDCVDGVEAISKEELRTMVTAADHVLVY